MTFPNYLLPAYVDTVRSYKHAETTSWRDFHLLQPWLPPCHVAGPDFAAVLRYQFKLERRNLPPTMTCPCRNRHAPPRVISSPAYHAYTCNFGARSRKLTHNYVCKLITKALNDGGRYVAHEVAQAEIPHGGAIPDINISPNHASLLPPLQGDAASAEHIDVTIVGLVKTSDYKDTPATMARRDHKKDRYAHKQSKHGPHDSPVVFDLAGGCNRASADFLKTALEGRRPRLSLLYRQVTAALARLIGRMDQRNTWARAKQMGAAAGPECGPGVDAEDDDAAWVLYEEEQQQARQLDNSFPDDELETDDPTSILHAL